MISALRRRAAAVGPAAPATGAGRARSAGNVLSAGGLAVLARRHWLIGLLLLAGLLLRLAAQLAYRPALFYIDTIRYLYSAQGNDPVAYRLPLRGIAEIANLNTVVLAQHLLGLAMAIAIYALLVRRGAVRWLAALAAAPVLLDAYQLQAEQTLMPDVLLEAVIVAGIVALAWRPAASLPGVIAGGLILGCAAPVRQVGEILILPALCYVLVASRGWRRTIGNGAVLCMSFVVPILVYCTAAYVATGHFWLSHTGVTTTYGRMAAAADCATLRLPASERGLCPTPAQRALGPDGLEHSPRSPLRAYYLDKSLAPGRASVLVENFNRQVLHQQPLNVLRAYAGDAVKLFALTRHTSPGDTPVSRWQFQARYPFYPPHASRGVVDSAAARFGGGKPVVWRPVAKFLRTYQLHGGYTPGPLFALAVLLGLAGSLTLLRRRRDEAARQLAGACLLFWVAAVSLLAISDLFEFSWRYQLPALVTLPPAAAAGLACLIAAVRRRHAPVADTDLS
jgi:hypothetical protein